MPDVVTSFGFPSNANNNYANNSDHEIVFNILLLGDQAVGKSTLSNTFVNGVQSTAYVPTVGVDFYFRRVNVDGYTVKLQLWDTAGQNQFMTFLNESYFQKANCVILMYDITKKSSFKEMKLWIEHIKTHCANYAEKMIVGNKFDLANDNQDQREVEAIAAQELADKCEFNFKEVCSLDARIVDRLFLQITRAMLLAHLRNQISAIPTPAPASSQSTLKRKPNISKNAFRENCDVLLKVLLVGEASVGKTSLMCRYVHDRFSSIYKSTIGIDFEARMLDLNGKAVKLQIWDTAGQEKFKALSPQYYRGADAVIVAYDISNRHSFEHILHWVHSVQMQNTDETVVAVVGNKCDIDPKLREVDEKLGIQLAESLRVDLFMETSAKACVNVGELFEKLARTAILKKKIDLGAIGESSSNTSTSNNASLVRPGLHNASKSPSSRWKCCSSSH